MALSNTFLLDLIADKALRGEKQREALGEAAFQGASRANEERQLQLRERRATEQAQAKAQQATQAAAAKAQFDREKMLAEQATTLEQERLKQQGLSARKQEDRDFQVKTLFPHQKDVASRGRSSLNVNTQESQDLRRLKEQYAVQKSYLETLAPVKGPMDIEVPAPSEEYLAAKARLKSLADAVFLLSGKFPEAQPGAGTEKPPPDTGRPLPKTSQEEPSDEDAVDAYFR